MVERADESEGTLLRLAAFTTVPNGGNPAGVWFGTALPSDDEMQRIAASVGYSETAFLAPDPSGRPGRFRVRYFSPLAEVPFCGHATIASGIALADAGLAAPPAHPGDAGRFAFITNEGHVEVAVAADTEGRPIATLTSTPPWVVDPPEGLVEGVLALLAWRPAELDPRLPPALAYAGARHLILAAGELTTLERLDYPFEPMRDLMLQHDLTTIQLVWRERALRFRARDPFAVGGIVEDPATGAAAAAFGAYLRDRGEIVAPARFEIVQGVEMGRPSLLTVSIVPDDPRIRVTGTAVPILD